MWPLQRWNIIWAMETKGSFQFEIIISILVMQFFLLHLNTYVNWSTIIIRLYIFYFISAGVAGSESDVYRRHNLTSTVGPRAERVENLTVILSFITNHLFQARRSLGIRNHFHQQLMQASTVNTRRWHDVGLTLGQRRRRWPNIKST